MVRSRNFLESTLRRTIVEALRYEAPRNQVPDTCGAVEFGIDFTFEREDAFGVSRLYGVQIKAGDLKSGGKGASRNVKELLGQISIAFGHRFQPQDKLLDGIYVIVEGEVNNHAREYIGSANLGFRQVYILDKHDLEKFLFDARARGDALKET
jgi:hypothetical protein